MKKLPYTEEKILTENISQARDLCEKIAKRFKEYSLSDKIAEGMVELYEDFSKGADAKSLNEVLGFAVNSGHSGIKISGIFSGFAEYLKMIEDNSKKVTTELNDLKNKPSNPTQTMENIISVPADIYINSSILMSAAPRKDKDSQDTELGEDTSGIMNSPFGTFFWVLDGTSDSPSIVESVKKDVNTQIKNNHECEQVDKDNINTPTDISKSEQIDIVEKQQKHIFSSRILAQSLSANVAKHVNELLGAHCFKIDSLELRKILEKSLRDTVTELEGLLRRAYDSNPQMVNDIKESITNNIIPYCSTTILLGFFAKSGHLQYIILGDSNVYSYQKNERGSFDFLGKDHNDNPSRLFLFLSLDKNNEIVINTNGFEEKIRPFEKKNIDLLFSFSDGIGVSERAFENYEQPKMIFWNISKANQGTYDDKTLIMLEKQQINSCLTPSNFEENHEGNFEAINASAD